ncbi:hypothetical protein [Hymenobacter arizonensis]|uniref:hypothetical protein n=1 Tax=Hymenobacter arizonensis TaxID=1227077 RepID=UPI0011604EE6|nr:hypothetical protein [Hymenobacter arizonensis]
MSSWCPRLGAAPFTVRPADPTRVPRRGYLAPVMTLDDYRALPYERQLVAALNAGTFLARRHEAARAVNLYHLFTFFVEVVYDPAANALVGLHAFRDPAGLAPYAAGVTLPDGLGG